MIDLFRRLLHPRQPLPPQFHYHRDDSGAKILCDDSTCRPAARVPERPAYLFPR